MSIVDDAIAQDVRTYAAQVRAALADLGPEQRDDLTDGLEANLADALADDGRQHRASLVDEFGAPEAYAAELRAAAGLEPGARAPRGLGRVLRAPGRRTRAAGERLLHRLRAEAWWPPVEDLAVALRPAWWVLRAWVVYQLVVAMLGVGSGWLPRHLSAWLLLGGLVVVSAQTGRGLWFTSRRAGAVLRAVSVVAVVALLPLAVTLDQRADPAWEGAYEPMTTSYPVEVLQDGVVVDGMAVSNLFVYDADGNPLSDVQIYDDRGRQVRTTFDEGQSPWFRPDSDEPWYFAPTVAQDGRARWNVYPLRGWPESAFATDDETGAWVPRDGLVPTTPPYPFAKAPALTDGTSPSTDETTPSTDETTTPTDETTPSTGGSTTSSGGTTGSPDGTA